MLLSVYTPGWLISLQDLCVLSPYSGGILQSCPAVLQSGQSRMKLSHQFSSLPCPVCTLFWDGSESRMDLLNNFDGSKLIKECYFLFFASCSWRAIHSFPPNRGHCRLQWVLGPCFSLWSPSSLLWSGAILSGNGWDRVHWLQNQTLKAKHEKHSQELEPLDLNKNAKAIDVFDYT